MGGLLSSWLVLVALCGCAPALVVAESSVVIRPSQGDSDSALVVVHSSNVCGLTIRDTGGHLRDQRKENEAFVPIDMARELSRSVWEIQNSGHPSSLAAAIAVPPGHYEIVEYAASDDWKEIKVPSGHTLGRTACGNHETPHRVRLPFQVSPGEVTLLALPTGAVDFDDLVQLGFAMQDPYVRAATSSWHSKIESARQTQYRSLVAGLKQARGGYDVYRRCDGKTAVVRSSGVPARWEQQIPGQEGDYQHDLRPALAIPSTHATGFGGGCVRPASFMIVFSDASQLDAAINVAGAWLVQEDIAAEIDLVVAGIPRPH